jgi:hypothetical protein
MPYFFRNPALLYTSKEKYVRQLYMLMAKNALAKRFIQLPPGDLLLHNIPGKSV